MIQQSAIVRFRCPVAYPPLERSGPPDVTSAPTLIVLLESPQNLSFLPISFFTTVFGF